MKIVDVDETGDLAPVLQVALETHQRPRGRLYLLTLVGDLDISTASDLQAATNFLSSALQPAPTAALSSAQTSVQPARTTGGCTLVVDLADLVFMDSAGLTALIALWRTVTRPGGTFCVLRPQPQVVRLFALTRADQFIPLCQDLVQALNSRPQPPETSTSSKAC